MRFQAQMEPQRFPLFCQNVKPQIPDDKKCTVYPMQQIFASSFIRPICLQYFCVHTYLKLLCFLVCVFCFCSVWKRYCIWCWLLTDGKCYLQGQTAGYLLAQMTETSEITMTGIRRGGGGGDDWWWHGRVILFPGNLIWFHTKLIGYLHVEHLQHDARFSALALTKYWWILLLIKQQF